MSQCSLINPPISTVVFLKNGTCSICLRKSKLKEHKQSLSSSSLGGWITPQKKTKHSSQVHILPFFRSFGVPGDSSEQWTPLEMGKGVGRTCGDQSTDEHCLVFGFFSKELRQAGGFDPKANVVCSKAKEIFEYIRRIMLRTKQLELKDISGVVLTFVFC